MYVGSNFQSSGHDRNYNNKRLTSLMDVPHEDTDMFCFTILSWKYVPRQLLAIYVLSMQVKGSTVVVHLFYDWKTFWALLRDYTQWGEIIFEIDKLR